MVVLNVALQFALFVFLGIFIIRIRLVDMSFCQNLSKVVMNVMLPCLIVDSIRSQAFDGHLDGLFEDFLLCIVTLAVLAVFGEIIYRLMKKTDLAKSARFSTIFGNFTFVGYAAVQSLYGAPGLFTYTLFTLPVRLIFYMAPSFMLTPNGVKAEKKTVKQVLKSFFNAPTVSVFIGLILYFTGLQLPEFLDRTVTALSNTASPLGMLICGMGLASATPKTLWERKQVALVVLCRNALAPVVMLAILYVLPVDASVKLPIFIYAAVPVPALLTTFSIGMKRSEEACRDASAAVLASTLLCILTLPAWVWVAERLLV